MTENVCEHVWSEGIDRGFLCMKPECDAWLTMEQAKVRLNEYEKLEGATEELLEVARLRGDNELLHPADDPKLWTARMQEAWDVLADILEET